MANAHRTEWRSCVQCGRHYRVQLGVAHGPPSTCCSTACRLQRNRDLVRSSKQRLDANPAQPRCDVVGCDSRATRRGWCGMHYARWMSCGDPGAAAPSRCKNTVCEVEGCGARATRKHLCNLHYSRLTAKGTTRPPAPRVIKLCRVSDCARKSKARGFCALHADRFKKYGDPLGEFKVACKCVVCGVEWESKKPGKTCSVRCASRLRDRVSPTKTCLVCGVNFPTHWTTQTCSPECKRQRELVRLRTWNQSQRETNPDYLARRRVAQQRRRARVRAVSVEDFTFNEIADRDRWTCGICGGPVDPRLSWPDQMSQSLDHVVPIAVGGRHVRENVQLAHLVCNMRKGAGRFDTTDRLIRAWHD